MKRPGSLQFRLSLVVAVCFLLAVLVVSCMTVLAAQSATNEEYDNRLITNTGIILNNFIGVSMDGMSADTESVDTASLLLREAKRLVAVSRRPDLWGYRIWRDEKVIAVSENSPLPADPAPSGLASVKVGEDHWRTYSISNQTLGVQVEGWENYEARANMQGRILSRVISAAFFIMLPLLGVIVAMVYWGLHSFRQLVTEVAGRSPADLSPIQDKHLPEELRPLSDRLNQLFLKLQETITLQRRVIDDAAHELRTPISALRLQMHQLKRARDEDERQESIDNLEHGVQRAARLFEQMLQLAKVGHEALPNTHVSIKAVLADVLPELARLALEKNVGLIVEGADQQLPANQERLELLLGILIDNAVKYSPAGSEVFVTVRPYGLSIEDNGPGIPPEHREQVFARFFRLNMDIAGSGLGLSLAKEICDRQGWKISLSGRSGQPGLRVDVLLVSLQDEVN